MQKVERNDRKCSGHESRNRTTKESPSWDKTAKETLESQTKPSEASLTNRVCHGRQTLWQQRRSRRNGHLSQRKCSNFKNPGKKHPINLRDHEKTKSTNNRNRGWGRNPGQRQRQYFQANSRIFCSPKGEVPIKEKESMQNTKWTRLGKTLPPTHNNQDIKPTEQQHKRP